MKYIKSQALFEYSNPYESIIDDIKDICLEFTDNSINYEIRTNIHYYADGISGCDCIMISLKDNQLRFFTIEDIEEILLRFKDYLSGTNWSIDCGFPAGDTYLSLDDFLVEFRGEEFYDLKVYIYNKPQIKPIGETIKVPIKVGDTVLGGRFKNKKMVVKKIGKNAKGDITINDKPLLKFRIVKESIELDSILNESIIYFSPKMRAQLKTTDNDLSQKMLDLEGTDIKGSDITFVDVDSEGEVTFITMPNAMKLIKAKYPDANNADLDVSGDKDIADIVYKNDISALNRGKGGDTGVYVKSRNAIKIGKLVNRLFKGTLTASQVEKFVNDFKASSPSYKEKIDLVSGEVIRHWYDENNYLSKSGTLGSSCMANKPGKYFNIYAQNPNTCSLLIMTVGDKLVARGLVWKLNSIESEGITNSKPQYFLDRVYANEDYQIEKMRRFAADKGWALRKYNSGQSKEYVLWNGKSYEEVSMSVKVNKSNYDNTYPYMDTFTRYDHFNGLLWNDEMRRKGGHILHSTQGDYEKSISRSRVYINKFKDFFSK